MRSAGVSRSAREIASSTSSEARTSRPCSSHVYQVVPTPASCETSSRRSPGVRRRPPLGQPDLLGLKARAALAQEVGELGAPALAVVGVHAVARAASRARGAVAVLVHSRERSLRVDSTTRINPSLVPGYELIAHYPS